MPPLFNFLKGPFSKRVRKKKLSLWEGWVNKLAFCKNSHSLNDESMGQEPTLQITTAIIKVYRNTNEVFPDPDCPWTKSQGMSNRKIDF